MPIRTVGLTPGHRWCGGLRSVKPAVNNGKGARGLVQGPNSLNASYTHPGRISGRPRKLARDLRNRHLDFRGFSMIPHRRLGRVDNSWVNLRRLGNQLDGILELFVLVIILS